MKHFVYVPLRVPSNVLDVPTFLNCRVEGDDEIEDGEGEKDESGDGEEGGGKGGSGGQRSADVDCVEALLVYSNEMAEVGRDFETKVKEGRRRQAVAPPPPSSSSPSAKKRKI
jgi:hypothetical protein